MAVTPAPDTLGPHAIGAEQLLTVSSDTPFAQVAGAILQKLSRVQNPDKD